MYYPRYHHLYAYPRPYGYYPYAYAHPYYHSTNLFNSQIATVSQSMFNAGVMTGVAQTANAYNIGGYNW